MSANILIAGTNSGVGKTTITMGLIAALRQRGLRVQPFKSGPDYIDPTYHTLAAGRPCRNIDTWMVPQERALRLYHKAAQGSDIAVIEGVMGVFDGFSYTDEEGSSAQIAKLVNAPVLLILDVGKMARSAGALALGYSRFDPALNIAGFILNRCGSKSHFSGVKQAVEASSGLPVLGRLPKDADLHIPERHLGLIPTDERGELSAFINHAAGVISQYFDIDQIIAAAQRETQPEIEASQKIQSKTVNPQDYSQKSKIKISVARDAAFSFYYEDNLDMLREAGAEIEFFSPLADGSLPADTCGIYIGGGFPEMYAAQLTDNHSLREDLRAAHQRGIPIYAECGGFMYLSEAMADLEGQQYPMVGLAPGVMQMEGKRVGLGYRLVESPAGNFLLPKGVTTRGHEFHWSTWSRQEAAGQSSPTTAWQIRPRRAGGKPKPDGYCSGNLIASYVHLHFAHNLQLAKNFVAACRQWSQDNKKANRSL